MSSNITLPISLLFLVVILLIALVASVMLARRRQYVHYFFALFMIAAAVWAFGINVFLLARTVSVAYISACVYYSAAAVIVYALILLVLSVPMSRIDTSDVRLVRRFWVLLAIPIIGMLLLVMLPNGLIQAININVDSQNSVSLRAAPYSLYTFLFLTYAAASTGVLFYKFRHAKERRYRRQLEYIAGSALLGIGFGAFFNLILPLFGVYQFIWVGPLCGIPVVVTVFYSIIRHSLFDIRQAIVRTVTYLLSLATLAAIYSLLVLAVSGIFSHGVDIVSAAIAIILAFIFQPIRRFFDHLTNRIFYKDNYSTSAFFAHLTRTLAVNTDLRGLLERSAREIAHTLKAKQGFFFVRYGAGLHVTAGTVHHSKIPLIDISTLDKRIKEGRDGAVVMTDFLAQDDEVWRLLVSHKIALVLPLLRGENIIGYLCLGEHQASQYTDRDIRTLQTIADELVIAIQNALSVQEVRELNDTLQQRIDNATKELRASNEQLRRLDEAKDEFVSMASHQLRTPLTSVKGYVSMLLEGDAGTINSMQKHFLEEAFTSSERMVHLINDFLNVSRLQTGKFVIDKRKTDLQTITAQEVDSLRTTAKQRQLTLKLQMDSKVPPLLLDENKIRQVIMNFIDNALYYSAAGTTILITLKAEKDKVMLSVKDTGIGVPKNEQAHLFEKFYRASNARRQRPDGTGVGLFLAKKVIIAHGGYMTFESEEGKGSTFGFSLPIKQLESSSSKNVN